MTAPLLLLDVDGVLNALGPRTTGAEWRRGTAEADGARWPITWSPAVVRRLRSWHESGRVEVQWLTTWGHDANRELRALLELPELAVAGTYDDEDADGAAAPTGTASHAAVAPSAPDPLSGHWWKYDVVRRLVDADPDRLVLWVDDELHEPDGPFRTWAERQPRLHPVGPHPAVGLTEEDLAAIESLLPG